MLFTIKIKPVKIGFIFTLRNINPCYRVETKQNRVKRNQNKLRAITQTGFERFRC